MKKEVNSSIVKIICVSLILLILSGIGVMAVSTQIENVKVTLSDGYEMTILTSKNKVSEILEENNIILAEDEKTIPSIDSELTSAKTIKITNKSEQEVQIAQISEEGVQTSLDEILKAYTPITEKIVTEQVVIPYETITKDVTEEDNNSSEKVLQEGKDGIKEVTYRVKYQNEKEIEKNVISEKVIEEPVDKIVKKQQTVSSRSATTRSSGNTTAKSGVYKVTAYCSCSKCCGKRTGRTASGTRATAGRTVAASSKFSFGTKLKINGKTYVVEDRGGAVKGNKIDVYMNSHSAALRWGVRYLPVEIVN